MRVAIEGMHCDACVRRVRKAIQETDGAKIEDVQVGWAEVSVDPAREAAVIEAVRRAGFEPRKS